MPPLDMASSCGATAVRPAARRWRAWRRNHGEEDGGHAVPILDKPFQANDDAVQVAGDEGFEQGLAVGQPVGRIIAAGLRDGLQQHDRGLLQVVDQALERPARDRRARAPVAGADPRFAPRRAGQFSRAARPSMQSAAMRSPSGESLTEMPPISTTGMIASRHMPDQGGIRATPAVCRRRHTAS